MDNTATEIEYELTTLQNDVCSKLNRLLDTNPKHSQLICNQTRILSAAIDSVAMCHIATSNVVEGEPYRDEDFIEASKLFLTDSLFLSPELDEGTSNQISSHEVCSTPPHGINTIPSISTESTPQPPSCGAEFRSPSATTTSSIHSPEILQQRLSTLSHDHTDNQKGEQEQELTQSYEQHREEPQQSPNHEPQCAERDEQYQVCDEGQDQEQLDKTFERRSVTEECPKEISFTIHELEQQRIARQKETAQLVANNRNTQQTKLGNQPKTATTRSDMTMPQQLRNKRNANQELKKSAPKRLKREILREIPSIPYCKFPLGEIYQTFADRSSSDNPDRLWLLTRLFFAIASQDAFVQLRNACLAIRDSSNAILLPSTNTVSANMESLDQLDISLATVFVIKRFHLVGLMEARTQLEQNYRLHQVRQTRRLRHEKRTSEQENCGRAASRALKDMLAQAYPDLKAHTVDYNRQLTSLKNRLSQGRNWHMLAARFGTGVLALVPTDGDFNVHDRDIERLPVDDFKLLLEILDKQRGGFLCKCSHQMAHFLNLLSRPNRDRKYVLEKVDGARVKQEPFDSLGLIGYLELDK